MAGLLVDWRPIKTNRNFRYVVMGQFVSLLGSNLTMVAIPYQVYRETHSSLWVGLASLIQLPFLIAGSLIGGAYGYRFEKRRLLVGGGVICGLVDAALAINAAQRGSHLFVLIAFAALLAASTGFTGPIRSAAIPKILGPDDLIAGYSINQVSMNTALVVGPTLGGFVLASFPLSACYLGDAVSFFWTAAMTLFIAPLPPSNDVIPSKLWQSIRDGFSYVKDHAIATTVWYADLNAMVFGMPRALFPAMALTVYHGGSRTLGFLYSAIGIGAVITALFTGWIQRVEQRGRAVILSIAVFGAAMVGLGAVHILWFGVIMLAIAGGMDVISTVLRNTILQLAITDEFRGRLSAIQMAVVTGGPRLGDIESGGVAAFTSTEFSVISGGLAFIVGIFYLAFRQKAFWNARSLTSNEG